MTPAATRSTTSTSGCAGSAYLIASGCLCVEPREFVEGWCHRCGRLIAPDPVMEGDVDAWIMVEAAIELGRMDLPDRARADGVDPADREAYAAWLEAGLPEEMRAVPAVAV